MKRLCTTLCLILAATICDAAPKRSTAAEILKGTRAQKQREERRIADLGLRSHKTFKSVEEAVRAGTYVRVESTKTYTIDPRMGSGMSPEERRAMRVLLPHTKDLLEIRASRYYARFRVPLLITALMRTEAYIRFLREKGNDNASFTSSHMYGAAFDIGYDKMTPEQVRWMEEELAPLELKGNIEAIKEGDPAKPDDQHCFHVMDRYAE